MQNCFNALSDQKRGKCQFQLITDIHSIITIITMYMPSNRCNYAQMLWPKTWIRGHWVTLQVYFPINSQSNFILLSVTLNLLHSIAADDFQALAVKSYISLFWQLGLSPVFVMTTVFIIHDVFQTIITINTANKMYIYPGTIINTTIGEHFLVKICSWSP